MLGFFFTSIANVLDIVLTVYMYTLIVGALLSWVNPDPYNPIVRFVHNVTEPLLSRVRRYLPVSFSGIDFSPMVVILGIIFLQGFLVNSIRALGYRLMH
ncbi:MAG: YggT family protein [Desulfatibacillum sp.]|nr:YggT family protein [Desulfatibacillum sp.]